MDIIKNKIQLYNDILPFIKTYVRNLGIARSHIYESQDRINTILSELSKYFIELEKNTESFFKLLHLTNNIRDGLSDIMYEINLDTDIHSTMSNTFLLDLDNELKKLNIKFEITIKTDTNLSHKYIHHVLPQLDVLDVKIVRDQFSKFKNTIILYSHYLQNKIDNEEDQLYILNELENVKYNIFNDENDHTSTLQRFGVIPVWQSLTVDRLIQITTSLVLGKSERNPNRMYGGYSTNILHNVSKIFKESHIGICLLVEIGKSNITFDFKNLIHKKSVQKYNSIPYEGVNKNIINRLDIIKELNNVSEVESNIYDLGDTTSDKWVIIRTVNGDLFDILGVNISNFYFSKQFIDKFKRGSSKLIHNYQQLANNKIQSFLKLPQDVVLNDKTQLHDIASRVNNSILQYLDAQLVPLPKNLKELYELSCGVEIEEIISKILIQSYENEGANADENKLESELSATFLANADYIIFIFVKYIKEGIAKHNFTEFMFKEKTPHALYIYIRQSLIEIIQEASKKAFNPQKDIYEKISVKKSLLKISLK